MPVDLVTVGYIIHPHGVRGELKVRSASGCKDRFAENTKIGVLVSGEEPWFTAIERVRPCSEGQLIKVIGIDTRDQAQKLAGGELALRHEDLEKLPDGAYYHFQLIGMQVEDENGRFLGTLEEIFPTGSNDVYVVRSEGKEVLLPAIDEVILQVDRRKKTIVVHLLEGLV